jgi:DNA/RNA-binding domain of Phe-tRNA-synthetase-like protein
VPAGGFDLRDLRGQIQLRLSRPGDTFAAFHETDAQEIGNAEVCYALGNRVLTRHFVRRQSNLGLIELETKSVLLVGEVLGEVREDDPSIAEGTARTREWVSDDD